MSIRSVLLGPSYFAARRLLEKSQYWPPHMMEKLQRERLRALLKFSVHHIPFYKQYQSIVDDHKDVYEALSKFPLIDKDIVRRNLLGFVLPYSHLRSLKATTGGSTGQPFIFYMDRFVTRQREKAFIFDQWSRVGYQLGDKIFSIKGRTPRQGSFVTRDPLFNIYYASSFNLSSSTVGSYVRAMNEVRPLFLQGYPSTMYQLALLMEGAGKRLNHDLRAVLCGSEKLFDYQRTKIEAVFKCQTYNFYGHSEYLVLGGECEQSRTFHVYPQYGYTELIPTGIKDPEGREMLEIVGTGFNNRVMPLIRYRTGDYALLSPTQECICGRRYLLLEDIVGREQEFIVDNAGNLISATSLIFGQHYRVFEGLHSIKLRQEQPGKVDIILVKDNRFKENDFDRMKAIMQRLLGPRVDFSFLFQDSIDKTPIGKSKLVDQRLNIHSYMVH